ncbi:MAG: hypothetical protein ABR886_12565 [Dehalococcoidales bacterium]|jgi:hypothetical protein
MSEKSYDSNKDDDEIPTHALLKFVSNVSGPLTHVEDVKLPKPLSPISPTSRPARTNAKRGPKSVEDWIREIRKAWGNLYEVDELGKSWLAQIPAVQKLAAGKYGGRMIGSGQALQYLLNQVLTLCQHYEMENGTMEILKNFPKLKLVEIASQLGINRSYLSRRYMTKASSLLTKAFQRVIDQSI